MRFGGGVVAVVVVPGIRVGNTDDDETAADAGDVRALVGNGFRDVTRIAAGRPEIWRDICLTNRDAILEGLLRLGEMLDEARRRIAAGAPHEVESLFEAGRIARRKALGE